MTRHSMMRNAWRAMGRGRLGRRPPKCAAPRPKDASPVTCLSMKSPAHTISSPTIGFAWSRRERRIRTNSSGAKENLFRRNGCDFVGLRRHHSYHFSVLKLEIDAAVLAKIRERRCLGAGSNFKVGVSEATDQFCMADARLDSAGILISCRG